MAIKKDRQPIQITLETVRGIAPAYGTCEKIAATFMLEPVDYDTIAQATFDGLIATGKALEPNLGDDAMKIHFSRIVENIVKSAHRTAEFYHERVSAARRLTTRIDCDDRDEDRAPVYGFDTPAERAREFAAKGALAAYALLASAEGAVRAFAELIGEDWKPYTPTTPKYRGVRRRAAEYELDTLTH